MKAGFLKEEAVAEAGTATDLEGQYAETLLESERLRAIADPETEPFRSRYEERVLLRKLARQADANAAAAAEGSDERKRAGCVGAAATALLGANFMDTEEAGQARDLLEKALAGMGESDEVDALTIETLNRLGVLAANREEHELSLDLLERALRRYESAVRSVIARVEALTTATAAAEAGTLEASKAESAASVKDAQTLEDLHTLTGFYLAQAYGNCGQATESAKWCQRTMERQLQLKGSGRKDEHAFKPHEWARNASNLSAYFCAENHFGAAESCLHAADAVLRAHRKAEKVCYTYISIYNI